jgi:hypothetical protein
LALGADGTIALAYSETGSSHIYQIWVWRPGQGWSLHDLSGADVAALAVQGDGKVLAVENRTDADELDVVRIQGVHPALVDNTFSGDGRAQIDLDEGGGNGQLGYAIVLSGGRAVVLGTVDTGGGEGGFALRLQNSLMHADGFESGSTAAWDAKK